MSNISMVVLDSHGHAVGMTHPPTARHWHPGPGWVRQHLVAALDPDFVHPILDAIRRALQGAPQVLPYVLREFSQTTAGTFLAFPLRQKDKVAYAGLIFLPAPDFSADAGPEPGPSFMRTVRFVLADRRGRLNGQSPRIVMDVSSPLFFRTPWVQDAAVSPPAHIPAASLNIMHPLWDDNNRLIFYAALVEDPSPGSSPPEMPAGDGKASDHAPLGKAPEKSLLPYPASPRGLSLPTLSRDPVTDLPNRQALQERMQKDLTAWPFGRLWWIHLAGLPDVYSVRGVAVGDAVIRAFVHRLSRHLGPQEFLSRVGDSQLALWVPGSLDKSPTAEHLGEILEPAVVISGEPIRTPVDVVAIDAPDEGTRAEALIQRGWGALRHEAADKIFAAPAVRRFDREAHHQKSRAWRIRQNLAKALAQGEFYVVYQPQISLNSGRVVGAEALLRWASPLGAVSPQEFIPLAEQSGAIHPLGRWVLQTACAQNRLWQRQGYPAIRMAVNLSAHQLTDPAFVSMVQEILEQTAMDAKWLELELTESAAVIHSEQALAILHTLRELGIRLALDDFGMGFSTLRALATLPITTVKIDQTFIRHLPKSPRDAALVGAMVAMTKKLGLEVIAEGVETAEQYGHLRALGCDHLQGFWVSPGISAKRWQESWDRDGSWRHLPIKGVTPS